MIIILPLPSFIYALALNSEILGNLFGFLETLKAPFITGGDWQNPPYELPAMVVQSKFKAHIKATEGPKAAN